MRDTIIKKKELKLVKISKGYININPPYVMRLNLQIISRMLLVFSDRAWNIISKILSYKFVNRRHKRKAGIIKRIKLSWIGIYLPHC